MRSIAFATYTKLPLLSDDDSKVADILLQRGIKVHPTVWDAAEVDWNGFERVIIRSVWDYHLKLERYTQWVSNFLGIVEHLYNPPEMVLSNLNKHYLINLALQGVDVVPSAYIKAGEPRQLQDISECYEWEQVVIKPAVSASGHGVWTCPQAMVAEQRDKFSQQLTEKDLLVQAYMPEVRDQGEWSLIFFNGEYSHGVLKTPAEGDFRVQRHYGGEYKPAVPSSDLIEQASSILTLLDVSLLYARVDGIERNGRFILMELEINEPYLFLSSSAHAVNRFADAISQHLFS